MEKGLQTFIHLPGKSGWYSILEMANLGIGNRKYLPLLSI
jgi:hypothetical protein